MMREMGDMGETGEEGKVREHAEAIIMVDDITNEAPDESVDSFTEDNKIVLDGAQDKHIKLMEGNNS